MRARWNSLILSIFAVMAIALTVIAVSGCAATGQQAPKSTEDTLRYAQATLTAGYTTLRQDNDARTITVAEARKYKTDLDTAKTYVDEADFLVSTKSLNVSSIDNKLALALAILQPLLIELQKRSTPATSPVR